MRKLPNTEHLFAGCEGDLYDTRVPQWNYGKPLRALYSGIKSRKIDSGVAGTVQVRAALRHGGFAWPGGYALFFITSDGAVLSFKAVRENLRSVLDSTLHKSRDGWRVVGIDSVENADGEPVICDHTGEAIE